jgi:hypothetical protein
LLLCNWDEGIIMCFAFCFSALAVNGTPVGEGMGLHRKVCTLIEPL